MVAILLAVISLLLLAAATEHQRAVELDARMEEVERHAVNLGLRADAFEIERNRAYDTIRALHVESKRAQVVQSIHLSYTDPMDTIPIDNRFIVNICRN